MKFEQVYLTENNTSISIDIDVEIGSLLQKGDVIYVFRIDEEEDSNIKIAKNSKQFFKFLLPENEPDRDVYEYVIYERNISTGDKTTLELRIIDRVYKDSDPQGILKRMGLD